jgi:response regulator RpfG family c-di-GMP phosphodiesterase
MKTKPKILYIDDEEKNLVLFKNSFRREFDIFIADSAQKGIKLIENTDFDVIITDQRMPEMTGVEFLKEVQKRFEKVPPNRLIISGYSDQEAIDEAFDKYQLYQLIQKPWEREEVIKVINEMLKLGE